MGTECFRDPSETRYEPANQEEEMDASLEELSIEESLVVGWRERFDEITELDPIEDAYFEIAEAMDRLYEKVKLIGREKRILSREAEHVRLAAVRFQAKLATETRRTRRVD